jgi:hypothetical protein
MIFDFLKRLYAKRSQSDDPVLRRGYQIAERARTDPQILAARRHLEEKLGLSGHEFDIQFASYWMSLEASGATSDWNADVEPLMQSVGIGEEEIVKARTNFMLAVLNRILLRVAIDRVAPSGEKLAEGDTDESDYPHVRPGQHSRPRE